MSEYRVFVESTDDEVEGTPAVYRTVFIVGVQRFVLATVHVDPDTPATEAQEHCESMRRMFETALAAVTEGVTQKNRQLRAWLRYISTGWPENSRETADKALEGQLAPEEYLTYE